MLTGTDFKLNSYEAVMNLVKQLNEEHETQASEI